MTDPSAVIYKGDVEALVNLLIIYSDAKQLNTKVDTFASLIGLMVHPDCSHEFLPNFIYLRTEMKLKKIMIK